MAPPSSDLGDASRYKATSYSRRKKQNIFKIESIALDPGLAGFKFFVVYVKIVIFYTEILNGKVVLWCFFTSETSEKIHNSTFLVNISV